MVAACFTLVCVLSLTYNPNVQKITQTKLLSNSEDPGSDERSGISLYYSLWAFPTFAASVMSFMFGSLGLYIPYIYLVSFLPVFPIFEYYFTATSATPTKVQSLPLLYSPSNAYYYNYCYCYCYYYCYCHYYYCCCCCCCYCYFYYYIRVINKIGPLHSGSLICLITSVTTDRIGRHEVLLLINHSYNKLVIF